MSTIMKMKDKRGMELTFSTIAMLVVVLIVLLVVLMFFRGGIAEIGAKFGVIGRQAGKGAETETGSGGSLDIGSLIGNIKERMCTEDSDCPVGKVCKDSWKCVKPGNNLDGKLLSKTNCQALCNSCEAAGKACIMDN